MKGDRMNEAELIKYIEELTGRYEGVKNTLDEVTPFVVAFKYCLESLESRLEELEHESELLDQDLSDGVNGYGITRKCFEVKTKKKLLSEILCFMCESIDLAKAGDIE